MRLGSIISLPNEYSHYGRILDNRGVSYTVEAGQIPEDTKEGEEVAYKVEIWGDGGLAYDIQEPD